jgi:uncharacterized protein YcbX
MPTSEQNFLGVVEELWRYPVKSMLGERLTATTVTENGLLGDRTYALRDTSTARLQPPRIRGNGQIYSITGPR